jgi:alkanesulfonate monooxygenase SsuD/methylene tetrahydromethanopterin reductase-like flavin-dependent oxidoreductase (luciferase family)
VASRERALLEAFGSELEDGEGWLEERRHRWVFGTPEAAREQVRRFAEAGVERMMLQDFLPWDLDMIDVIGEELVGRV